MSSTSLLQKIIYWDVYISTIIHAHESAMLTALLFLPGYIFSPTLIAAPIFLITYLYGYLYAVSYTISITLGVVITVKLKHYYGRPRPKPRQLPLKPMFFRNKETNNSMPSGDCVQAAIFMLHFLSKYNGGETLTFLIILLLGMNVMLSRVYFCCHYFTDCYVGFGIGLVIGLLVMGAFRVINIL